MSRSKFEDRNALRVKGYFHITSSFAPLNAMIVTDSGTASEEVVASLDAATGNATELAVEGLAAGGKNTRCTHSGHSGQKRTTKIFFIRCF